MTKLRLTYGGKRLINGHQRVCHCVHKGVDYVAKNWALAMMLKALPLVQFWSVLLLKEQMMASAGKTLKTLVW